MDRLLAAHPYVAHVFVFSPDGGIVFRSQSDRLKSDSGFRDEADYLSKMYEGWLKMDFKSMSEKLVHLQKKGSPYMFEPQWVPRGDKKVYQSTALFAIPGGKKGEVAIAGVAFDADYLHDKFFPEMLEDVISRNVNDAQTDRNHAVMMLRGKYDSTAFAHPAGGMAAHPKWSGTWKARSRD